jgi:ABC-type nitrate/sulfonate/bicarbonate transport system substrate-binding protein
MCVVRRFLVVALCLGLLSPVAPARAQNTPAIESINLATYGRGMGNWCLYTALDQGYFKEAGVKIDHWLYLYGDPELINALVSRQVDVALGAVGTVIPEANGQTDQIVVVGGVEGYPVSLIAPDSITSPQQLAGKTISMPNQGSSLTIIGAYQLDRLVGKGKWNALYSGGPNTAHFALMQAGKVDAVLVNDPATLDPSWHFHILARLNGGQTFLNGPLEMGKTFLHERPQAAIRFLAAYLKGCNFILDRKNRDAAIDSLVKGSGLERGLDRQAVADAYDFYVLGPQRGRTPPKDGRLDVKGYIASVNLLKDYGTITNKGWDPMSAVDESYLNQAMKLAATLH